MPEDNIDHIDFDDLNKKVDDGFARVDLRFAQVDQRLAQVDQRLEVVEVGTADMHATSRQDVGTTVEFFSTIR